MLYNVSIADASNIRLYAQVMRQLERDLIIAQKASKTALNPTKSA